MSKIATVAEILPIFVNVLFGTRQGRVSVLAQSNINAGAEFFSTWYVGEILEELKNGKNFTDWLRDRQPVVESDDSVLSNVRFVVFVSDLSLFLRTIGAGGTDFFSRDGVVVRDMKSFVLPYDLITCDASKVFQHLRDIPDTTDLAELRRILAGQVQMVRALMDVYDRVRELLEAPSPLVQLRLTIEAVASTGRK